jgi:hypothetical protein
MKTCFNGILGLVGVLAVSLLPVRALATEVVVGFNFVHPASFSVTEQDDALAHMKSAGVRVIRIGFWEDLDKNVDFIKRAYARGIRTVLIFHGKYAPDAPVRPYRPTEFPGMLAGPPLSFLDPELSRQYFHQAMDKLDAHSIALAGMELENEINMAGGNPDFRLPGEGRVLSLDDLTHDPEGQQIAKGYLQYLRVLTVLKQIRDHSKLSQHAPLLPTSLVDTGPEGPWPTPKKYDGVSPGATLAFFRAHGVDELVDTYNIHTYPSMANGPGDRIAAIHRRQRLQQLVEPLCARPGSRAGKPCWVTEWGFTNDGKSCPSDERTRSLLVQEMMDDFRKLVRDGRLTGLIYYSWIGEALFDMYCCGALTQSGRLAIAPM